MDYQIFIQNTLIMGAWTTGFTTFGLVSVAMAERIPAFQPINAVSHIVFGDQIIGHRAFDSKLSLTGLALNTGAMIGWSAVAEAGYTAFQIPRANFLFSFILAIALTSIAFITDFYIVPKRFTPGFERVISKNGLYVVYTFLAMGFFIGGLSRIN